MAKKQPTLHELLITACPPDEKGRRSIAILAQAVGVNRASVYLWMKQRKLPPERAAAVVDVSDGRVNLRDFDPFVYRAGEGQ